MWTAIAQFAAGLMKIIGIRMETKNAPDVKAAAKAQKDVDERSKHEKAVADRDVDATRRSWSE